MSDKVLQGSIDAVSDLEATLTREKPNELEVDTSEFFRELVVNTSEELQ